MSLLQICWMLLLTISLLINVLVINRRLHTLERNQVATDIAVGKVANAIKLIRDLLLKINQG